MGMRGIRSPPQEGEGGLEPRETVEQSAVSMQSSSAITSKTPIVQGARLLEVCVTQSSSCDAQNEGCLQPRSAGSLHLPRLRLTVFHGSCYN